MQNLFHKVSFQLKLQILLAGKELRRSLFMNQEKVAYGMMEHKATLYQRDKTNDNPTQSLLIVEGVQGEFILKFGKWNVLNYFGFLVRTIVNIQGVF